MCLFLDGCEKSAVAPMNLWGNWNKLHEKMSQGSAVAPMKLWGNWNNKNEHTHVGDALAPVNLWGKTRRAKYQTLALLNLPYD